MAKSRDPGYRLLAAEQVRRHVRVLARQIRAVRKRGSPERIHQVRVASRRLRAALWIFRDCFAGKRLGRWSKQLRRLNARFGQARDADVQMRATKEVLSGGVDKARRPGIRRWLLRLKQRRAAAQLKVPKALDRLEGRGVLEDIQGCLARLTFGISRRQTDPNSPQVRRLTGEQIGAALEELLSYQDCLGDAGDQRRHHRMRLAAKRLRYAMEICRGPYEGRLDDPIQGARKLQTLLGDLHDCDVRVERLEEFAAKELDLTREYLGHDRAFARLRAGIDCLQDQCRRSREKTFRELGEYWRELIEQDAWGRLRQALGREADAAAPGQPPVPATPKGQTAGELRLIPGRSPDLRLAGVPDRRPGD
jgi:CHAD domain-containing protein